MITSFTILFAKTWLLGFFFLFNGALPFSGTNKLIVECLQPKRASQTGKNSIRDARTPQHEGIVFNTMMYRSSETVQRLGYFQSSVRYIKVQIMFK